MEKVRRVKIAIAGGNGFIGTPLAKRLRADGHEVQVWDLPDFDILDRGSIDKHLESFEPECVVNLAAVLGGMNARNIREIFGVNFIGNLNLADAAAAVGVKRFVFASSLTVHGSNDPAHPVSLASPFNPRHAYGASKAASEFALREYAKQGMTVVALRPTIILGDTKIDHAPIDFIKTILQGGEIEIFGTGEHEREWIWIDDAVDGFARAIAFIAAADSGYYPFFLSANRIRMKDLAERVAARLGGKVKFVPSQAQAFTLTADMAESAARLGWSASHDINAMIELLIPLLQANAHGT
ncbi:MAG: hypothetical protein A3A44_01420 [Candidatus Sungbacteria bacterium RIFCSPLOWO2_01_FULL_60_25]|uniref:NAD-dependent epimerase/dehydratase domain-containing protein n=1 Tax=Candidatus Sungbacteria bacterium RIFCSPLOWO2_01_FULL_60_25 TaxID=1802281 RepID=A0A1G2LH53_9BACT|nr:MAG: hypothetical protein A3A44_01420 [Candidatus Sungbacteria bacterium RIFCSPLOWO2_01_FULL_60_25]